MPISINKDKENHLTICTALGETSPKDVEDAIKSMLKGEPANKFLWDLRKADITNIQIGEKEILRFVDLSGQYRMRRRTAIVASKDVIFGLSKMFEAYASSNDLVELCVFRTMEEAIQWLSGLKNMNG